MATILKFHDLPSPCSKCFTDETTVEWQTDSIGRFMVVGPEWAQLTGRSLSPDIDMRWLDSIHPDDRTRVARQWYCALGRCTAFITSYRLRLTSGEYVPVRVRSDVIVKDGQVTGWRGTCRIQAGAMQAAASSA
jgi:PAS domain-containing protein